MSVQLSTGCGQTCGNPNPFSLDKVSMTTTTPPAHYKNPALIPADELAEAETSFRAVSETEHEYEWRMRNYKFYRIGWGWQVRRYYPHFVMLHEEALQRMTDACDHKFVSVPHTASECHILGTYNRGLMNTCTKCGHREYKQTEYNNYSGD